jgi:hypothetical protein
MARAQFQKNQRVYVRPVGTWAQVERVVPHWTKGLEEPIRIYYDVGLGREFGADELQCEGDLPTHEGIEGQWRVSRARNKWQSDAETATHPYPGTYPVVITGDAEWGGWRVPVAEYAVSPSRIERQARIMVTAPHLVTAARAITQWAQQTGDAVPEPLEEALRLCREALTFIEEAGE